MDFQCLPEVLWRVGAGLLILSPRYHEYQRMMYMGGYGGGYNMGFGNNYYNRWRPRTAKPHVVVVFSGTDACLAVLPTLSANSDSASVTRASQRAWSFISLLCSSIYLQLLIPFSQGVCYPGNQRPPPRASDFQPFQDCASTSTCMAIDMNLICNTNLTTGNQGKCQCRTNMRWNTEAGECQVHFQGF